MKSSCLFSTFLSIGLVCTSLFLSAQTAPIALPPTPEAQSLLKTVNMQVNKSTGIAGFSIPLYEAQVGGIRVPIVLSYSCAALKVRDIASWVGTGWNLSAGGKITRVVVDRDDLEGGYAQGQGRTAQNLAGWWDGASVKEERKERHAGDPCTGCLGFDGEPDLFYYEIPGRSGMFVIDYTGKVWTIPYSNLKIELRSDQSFVITDEAANQYFFTQKERTYETSHSDWAHTGNSGSPYGEESEVRSYISTWHLTRIENLAGEQITFSYQLGAEISYEKQ